MQLAAASSFYDELGTQNVAVGGELAIAAVGGDDQKQLLRSIGARVRYAHQVGGAADWRGVARVAFGLAPCQLVTCKSDDPYAADEHDTISTELGVEHLIMLGATTSMSAELGAVYTHADQMLGNADFIGLSLGFRVAVDLVNKQHATP